MLPSHGKCLWIPGTNKARQPQKTKLHKASLIRMCQTPNVKTFHRKSSQGKIFKGLKWSICRRILYFSHGINSHSFTYSRIRGSFCTTGANTKFYCKSLPFQDQACKQVVKSWKEKTPWKRPWCWESVRARGEGDDRGWDGWTGSSKRPPWIWPNSRRQWKTGGPDVVWSMGSRRVGHDLTTKQQQQMVVHEKKTSPENKP